MVSREAADLYAACEVVDIHVESFVWTRVFGYDLAVPHGRGLLGGRLYSQADVPRLLGAGVSGVVWSIATNPLRRRDRRTPQFERNVTRLETALARAGDGVEVVAGYAGYRRARGSGRLACFLAIQGGNALDSTRSSVTAMPDEVSRVTLVHLSRSTLGTSSAPMGGGRRRGLTRLGREYVETLNARRVLVDLAHASEATFWDAVAAHDPSLPVIVSHTGVKGVHDSWRNIDDRQIRAVADRCGVVGIMYHCGFLGSRTVTAVARHLEHVVRVGGEDTAALGSDWDGLIIPPRELRTPMGLPTLVQCLLDRGWPPDRVRKVMGANYLRVVQAVRPAS